MSPAPVRLLILTLYGERLGGSDNILLTFLRHVDRDRIEPTVAFFGAGGFEREVAALGVRTLTLPEGRLRNPAHVLASAARVRSLLRRERPDLILNWLSTVHVYGGLGALAAGMSDRCVWWQLDLFEERAPERARRRDRLATTRGRLLDRLATAIPAAAVGAVSEAAAEAQRGLRPRRPAIAVLPGIDPPGPAPPAAREELRERLGISPDALVVGTIGRLFAWKGHHLLVDALATLRGRGVEAHGLIVGGGGNRPDPGYEEFLRARVSARGLAGHVTFTGQVPDGAAHLPAMDVFVSASSPEPFGLVVLEAMAAGVPVVAVGSGGPAEIIEDGRSGVLVPANEPEVLADSIGALLADQRERERLGQGGRARFHERFEASRTVAEMQEMLESLVP